MQIIRQARFWLGALIVATLAVLPLRPVRAASFPDRPVHIVIGVSPGGSTDVTARLFAQNLSKIWGQSVIVETRLGAAGAVAYEYVAKAPADGYTLLVTSGNFTANSALRSDLPYNVLKDFTPVSLVAVAPSVLVVTPSLPVHSVKDLIALAKAEPGKLTYGSSGVGSTSHLNTAHLGAMAGIDIVHVPYQGTTAANLGAAEGEIDMTIGAIPAAQSLVTAGKLRLIAITSLQRSPLAPSIPTVAESGVPGYVFMDWYGMLAPPGLPPEILATINAAVAQAAAAPNMKTILAQQGMQLQTDTPPQLAALIRDDLRQKQAMVKLAGLKVQ